MANASNTEKPRKTSFFRGVKQEWKKITWPSKNDVVKQADIDIFDDEVQNNEYKDYEFLVFARKKSPSKK